MSELVLYQPESGAIRLYRLEKLEQQLWAGFPYICWRTLEISIEYGWEVIGEL